MTIPFSDFVLKIADSPTLTLTSLLIIGVIFVNAWTDAPNSITACIVTRAMEEKYAIIMAVVLNFFGVFFVTIFNARVAYTIFNIVDFSINPSFALIALCSSQFAVVIWSVAAWYFGIPTSESHALIAGITGSSIALNKGLAGINFAEWEKVLVGMFGSTFFGILIGYLIINFIAFHFFDRDRRELTNLFRKGQILGSGSMAFLHGSQSGQKFMGVFLLAWTLTSAGSGVNHVVIPVWLMIVTAFFLAFGTSMGGYRIMKSVGQDMVKMDIHEGFASDIGASIIILISTLLGIPVSTTHVKMSSFVGVGMYKRLSNINWSIVANIIIAWILTFPGCGLISYLLTNIVMRLF